MLANRMKIARMSTENGIFKQEKFLIRAPRTIICLHMITTGYEKFKNIINKGKGRSSEDVDKLPTKNLLEEDGHIFNNLFNIIVTVVQSYSEIIAQLLKMIFVFHL